MAQVALATTRLGNRLAAMPIGAFIALVAALAFLKSTFLWRGSFLYQEAEAFPAPVTHFSTNFLPIIIHRAAGGYVSLVFLSASLLALAAAVISLVYFLWQQTDGAESRRIAIVLAFAWPGVLIVLPWIGNGTAFLPLFMVLTLLARPVWIWLPALLLAIATHPEHAFVGLSLLALLAIRPEFKGFRTRSLVGAVLAGSVVLLTSLWLSTQGVSGRQNEFTGGIDFALPFAFRNGILGAYTWWGLWWLVVGFVLVVVGRRTRWVLLSVAVLLPAVMTAFTADYTRVFVGITLPVGIALVTYLLKDRQDAQGISEGVLPGPGLALGFWFLTFILLPNLIFMMPGDGVPTPGSYWVGLVENYVLPRL